MRNSVKLAFGLMAVIIWVGCSQATTPAPPPDPPSREASTGRPPIVEPTLKTPDPIPTAVPTPSLTRLTEPGCCTQPDWSANSTQVRFVDRPASTSVVGLYAVGLEGDPPTLVGERLGLFSPDDHYLAYPEASVTYIEDVSTGQSWPVNNGGRQVSFSPDSTRLVWTFLGSSSASSGGFDQRPVDVNVTSLDGTLIQEPITLDGGGFSGWLDDEHLLVVGRLEPGGERGLYSLALADESLVELALGDRLRSAVPAPGGEWIAYLVLFDQEESADNGLWIVSADGQTRYQLDDFGAIQWRDSQRLLLVPQDANTDQNNHRLLQIDAPTGEVTSLTDPDVTPFTIEGGDWRVSPDGAHVAFVSAADKAIWLLTLP